MLTSSNTLISLEKADLSFLFIYKSPHRLQKKPRESLTYFSTYQPLLTAPNFIFSFFALVFFSCSFSPLTTLPTNPNLFFLIPPFSITSSRFFFYPSFYSSHLPYLPTLFPLIPYRLTRLFRFFYSNILILCLFLFPLFHLLSLPPPRPPPWRVFQVRTVS